MRSNTSPIVRAAYSLPLRAATACLLLLAGAVPAGTHTVPVAVAHPTMPPVATMASRQQPLYFGANRGQTDSSVRFLAHGHGYPLFLTDQGAVFRIAPSGQQRSAVVRLTLAG